MVLDCWRFGWHKQERVRSSKPADLKESKECVKTMMTAKAAAKRQALEDTVQQAHMLRRKGVRAYLGLWGMAFDCVVTGAMTVAQQGIQFSQQAEERGEAIEHTLRNRLGDWERRTVTGLVWLRERIDEQLPTPAARPTAVPIVIPEAQPTPPHPVAKGTILIDNTAAPRIIAPLPLANYDQLMAKQVIDQLARLTVDELQALQEYEKQHAARITVLRAIDQTVRRKLDIV